MSFSDLLADHACSPRNVGVIEEADGTGTVGDPHCGDFVIMTIRVRNSVLEDVRFLARGCGAAIAACSVATVLTKGHTVTDAAWLTSEEIASALDGMPEDKLHCADLAATAFQRAVGHYLDQAQVDLHDWRSSYAKATLGPAARVES